MRLNAFVARAGVASRRGADALIDQGRVAVNGEIAVLGTTVEDADVVTLDGVPLAPQEPAHVLLHKPPGVITTARDPQRRLTVLDLVERDQRLFPVGRLDADTTGALLLTNDGALAHRLAHPRFGVEKAYLATVRGTPDPEALQRLRGGVELDDGLTSAAQARLVDRSPVDDPSGRTLATIELVLHEGRKHQVKRMLAAVGHPVEALHRARYAMLTVDDLEPGEWRELSDSELDELRRLTAG